MYTPSHTAVGMALVASIPNLWISIPAAVLSHFLLDLFPENSTPEKLKWSRLFRMTSDEWRRYFDAAGIMLLIECELIFVIVCSFCWASNAWQILLIGAIAANLLDIIDGVLKALTGREVFGCHPGGVFPPRKWFTLIGGEATVIETLSVDIFIVSFCCLVVVIS